MEIHEIVNLKTGMMTLDERNCLTEEAASRINYAGERYFSIFYAFYKGEIFLVEFQKNSKSRKWHPAGMNERLDIPYEVKFRKIADLFLQLNPGLVLGSLEFIAKLHSDESI